MKKERRKVYEEKIYQTDYQKENKVNKRALCRYKDLVPKPIKIRKEVLIEVLLP